MDIAGGCLCGAVRYRAQGEPIHQTLCHCGNCRRAVGGHVVAWVTFMRDRFEITQGSPQIYDSDTGATWTFCGQCGTTLLYQHDKQRPAEIDLTVGSLDDPEAFPSQGQINEDERLSWV